MQLAVLELLVVTCRYSEAQSAHTACKAAQNIVRDELIALEAANKPFTDSREYVISFLVDGYS